MIPITTVRVILEDDLERILMLKRANGSYNAGAWSLPGGKVDYNASLEKTCREEVYEETGLELENLRYLFHRENLPKHNGEKHCMTHYFTADYKGTPKINESESSAAKWIHPDEIFLYRTAFDNDIGIRQFRELKGREKTDYYLDLVVSY